MIWQSVERSKPKLTRPLSGALIAAALNSSGPLAHSIPADTNVGKSRMAFLSERHDETQQPTEQTPQQDNTNFDGKWIFTSAGCPHTGSLPAIIRQGKIIIRGGSGFVTLDGTLHSVGAGGGMTLTAIGQMSGNTGAGTFNRSDGCIGSWIAIKR